MEVKTYKTPYGIVDVSTDATKNKSSVLERAAKTNSESLRDYAARIAHHDTNKLYRDTLIFWTDDYAILRNTSERIIKDKYSHLSPVKIDYIWRSISERVGDNYYRNYNIRKYPNRIRDVLGRDCYIEVCAKHWINITRSERKRIVENCLRRISPYVDESGQVLYDINDRLRFDVKLPDIIIEMDKRDIEEYGVPDNVSSIIKYISEKSVGIIGGISGKDKPEEDS